MITFIDANKEMAIGTVVQQSKANAQVVRWNRVGNKWAFPVPANIITVKRDEIIGCGLVLNSKQMINEKDQEKIDQVLRSLEIHPSLPPLQQQTQLQPHLQSNPISHDSRLFEEMNITFETIQQNSEEEFLDSAADFDSDLE